MKRIIHVLNDLSTFFSHRQSLVDFLSADHQVILLVPDHLDVSELNGQGYDVRGYRLSRKGLNPFKELQSLLNLRALYRELKPDLVHHFTIKPVIYGTLAARMAGVPKIINTVTGLGYVFTGRGWIPKLLRPLVGALYKAAFHATQVQVIFQNRDDRALFLKDGLIPEARAHLVPGSGVNTEKFKPAEEPPTPPFKVVLPARMLWDKGIAEFIEASRLIRLERQDIEFELVGGLDINNRMAIPEPQIREWEAAGLVKWRGRVEDMVSVYHGCHIVCLPSYGEGIPMALLEAMSCGKAIVTTDVPGCRELIQDNQNGIVVPARDASKLATSLNQLTRQENQRSTLGERAQNVVKQVYRKEIINEKVQDLYHF